jgi:hypothetical protein
LGRDKWGLSGVRTSAGTGMAPVDGGLAARRFPSRQLLKVRLTTVILDQASRAAENGWRRSDEARDAEAVRAALRSDANLARFSRLTKGCAECGVGFANSGRAVEATTSITDGDSVSGDRKLKESTPRLAPGRPQPPTMGFDNRAADRKAHAHAVGLRRVEGFKETRQALRA